VLKPILKASHHPVGKAFFSHSRRDGENRSIINSWENRINTLRLQEETRQMSFIFLKLIISWVFSFHKRNVTALNAGQNFKGLIRLKREFSRWHRER
jgi:hypothetical protein